MSLGVRSSTGVLSHRDQPAAGDGTLDARIGLLTAALDASSDGIIITRFDDARPLAANAAFCRLAGLEREALVGISELEIWEDRADRERLIETLRHRRHVQGFETRLRGHPEPVDVEITAHLETIDGEVCVVCAIRDVSRRKHAQREAAVLLESVSDPLLVLDGRLGVTQLNGEALRLAGGRREEIIGSALRRVLPDAAAIEPRLRHALAEGEVATFETSLDGRWFEIRAFPFRRGLTVYARDITDRRAAEMELRESERRFRDVLETIRLAAVVIDLDGCIAFCNDHLARLTGWERAELTDRDWWETFQPFVEHTARRGMIEQIRAGAIPAQSESSIVARDGSRRLISWSTSPLRDADGRLIGVTRIGGDITDRRRAESLLAVRERQGAAVAALGQRALVEPRFDVVMQEAAATLAETLDLEIAAVMELLPSGRLVKRAICGWPPEMLGHMLEEDSSGVLPARHMLEADGPVIINELGEEDRFAVSPELREQGVRSGLGVRIHLPDRTFGVISGYSRRARTFTSDDVNFLQALANVVAAAIQRERAIEALRESEARRREVLGAMMRAEEEERARIAADLHDDTVQVITATLLSLDRVSTAIEQDRPERVATAATTARRTLSTAVERTRRLMFELRPPLLEANGLAAAVRDLAQVAAQDGGFEVDVDTDVGRHPQPVEALVYRTLRECMANVVKHSGATQVQGPCQGGRRQHPRHRHGRRARVRHGDHARPKRDAPAPGARLHDRARPPRRRETRPPQRSGRGHARRLRGAARGRRALSCGSGARGRLHRGVVAVPPLVPGAVVDGGPRTAGQLERGRDGGGRDAAVAVGDDGAANGRRVDAALTQHGGQALGRQEAAALVEEAPVGDVDGAGDVAGATGVRLLTAVLALGAGVEHERPAAEQRAYVLEAEPRAVARAWKERLRRRARPPLAALERQPGRRPGGDAAVEDVRVLVPVGAQRPGDAAGQDAPVAVVGDDGRVGADTELGRLARERVGRGQLHGHGVAAVGEGHAPVDEDRTGHVPLAVEVGQRVVAGRRRAHLAAHVEHQHPLELAREPGHVDEDPARHAGHATGGRRSLERAGLAGR
jgi:PAS domain S-box-containing protein